MAEIKSESVADFMPESVTDVLRNQHFQREPYAPLTSFIISIF